MNEGLLKLVDKRNLQSSPLQRYMLLQPCSYLLIDCVVYVMYSFFDAQRPEVPEFKYFLWSVSVGKLRTGTFRI